MKALIHELVKCCILVVVAGLLVCVVCIKPALDGTYLHGDTLSPCSDRHHCNRLDHYVDKYSCIFILSATYDTRGSTRHCQAG